MLSAYAEIKTSNRGGSLVLHQVRPKITCLCFDARLSFVVYRRLFRRRETSVSGHVKFQLDVFVPATFTASAAEQKSRVPGGGEPSKRASLIFWNCFSRSCLKSDIALTKSRIPVKRVYFVLKSYLLTSPRLHLAVTVKVSSLALTKSSLFSDGIVPFDSQTNHRYNLGRLWRLN